MASNNTGETIIALLTGAIIGASVGILFAPEKGSKTRKKISKEAKKAQETAREKFHETTSTLSEKAQEARTSFMEKLNDTLSVASTKADDILRSMEEKLEEVRKQNSKAQEKAKDLAKNAKKA